MFAFLLSDKMDPFYQNISSFPTIIFTILLAVLVLYWLMAVLGLVDIEVLDFDLGELDLDAANNTSLNNVDALAGLMLKLGLNGVPVTIIVSFISLFGWLICYYLVHFGQPLIPDNWFSYVIGLGIALVSFFVAGFITALVIKPLRPLFKSAVQQSGKYLLGQVAIVRTSRVDEGFGEATLEDGGAGLILKVRADSGVQFKLGDRVVLFEYLSDSNAYRVISEDEFANA